MSYDKKIKLYSHSEISKLALESGEIFGKEIWQTYKPVETDSDTLMWAKVSDIKKYKLTEKTIKKQN